MFALTAKEVAKDLFGCSGFNGWFYLFPPGLEMVFPGEGLHFHCWYPYILISTGCALWAESHHFAHNLRAHGATCDAQQRMVETACLERGGSSTESPASDRAGSSEYGRLVVFSLNVWTGGLLYVLLLGAVVSICVVVSTISSIGELSEALAARDFIQCALLLALLSICLRKLHGLACKLWKWRQACCTHPRCRLTGALLFVASVVYAVLVYLSPVPSIWRWILIATHTPRALKVIVPVIGQYHFVEEPGEEVTLEYCFLPVGDGGAVK